MRDVVVVEAVRSPVGRRNGGLSGMHSADLLFLADYRGAGICAHQSRLH